MAAEALTQEEQVNAQLDAEMAQLTQAVSVISSESQAIGLRAAGVLQSHIVRMLVIVVGPSFR